TKLALADDPSIAMTEINHEQSLFFAWRQDQLNYTDAANVLSRGNRTISYHHSRRLDSLYSTYLRNKYGTDQTIDRTWIGDLNPPLNNLLDDGSVEHQSPFWNFIMQ